MKVYIVHHTEGKIVLQASSAALAEKAVKERRPNIVIKHIEPVDMLKGK